MISKTSKKYISFGLFFHLLAVILSTGFLFHDEQRQVLQLVGYKLGNYGINYLDVQYTSALRSWFHPALYLLESKILLFFTSFDPFIHAFFYRLLSSALGLLGFFALYKTFKKDFKEDSKELKSEEIFFLLCSSLWFFPLLHARTANENVCVSFFLFGLYFLELSTKVKTLKYPIIAGLLLGLSFITRFQMGFMIAPTMFWYLFFKKHSLKQFSSGLMGIVIIIITNYFFDSAMYGHSTFTPYNYFHINITQGYAASFGVTPWYQYFIYAFKDGIPPISLIIIATFLALWIKLPKSLLTWITLPFVVVHALIGHKELRFLFPIIYFLPVIIPLVADSLKIQLKGKFFNTFVGLNIILMIFSSLTPASNLMKYYAHLYYKNGAVTKVYVSSPMEDFTKFYLKNDMTYVLFKNEEIPQIVKSEKKVFIFAHSLLEKKLTLDHPECKIDFSLFPEWLYEIEFIKKRRTFKSWTLIECTN